MAAGQPKKRSNSASVMRFNALEQRKLMKKRKYESSDYVLNMTSHISLEWDDSQRRAVGKREQVGISWRDMAPFVDSIPRPHPDLADVFSVPEEIFGLESINEVLSYEVWETYLSEKERKFLIQFLPCGIDTDQVLQSLLMGQNLHFGSALCKWGASLCAGNVHPDAVLSRNQHLKADKKSYYSVLKQYHTEIIENLLKWKERWTSCKNPEKDIVENMWKKGITNPDYGSLSIVSERAKGLHSKGEKPHKICIQEGATMKYMSYIKVSRKQLELVKDIKHSGDGIQSKSLKHVLGDIKDFCIRPYETFEEDEGKRLHDHWVQLATKDILGAFEDRRKRRLLRDLWGKILEQELVEKPIMEKDEKKENLESSLLEGIHNGESEHPSTCDLQDQGGIDSGPHSNDSHQRNKISPPYNYMLDPEDVDSKPNSTGSLERIYSLNSHVQYQEEVNSALDPSDSHHLETIPFLNSHQEFSHNVPDQGGNYDISKPAVTFPVLSRCLGKMNLATDVMESKASQTSGGHHLERVPSCNSPPSLCPMILGKKGNQYIEKQADILPQIIGNVNPTRDLLEPKASVSSVKDIWPAVHIQSSYFHPTSESRGYESAGGLSLGQPQPVEEHPAHFTDMQTDMLDQRIAKPVASASDMETRASMFGSYAIRDHDVMLPPFPKEQGMLPPYPQGHLQGLKHSGLQFMVVNDTSQFPHQFQGPQQGLHEQRQAREREIYMHQMMSKNMNSNGRYPSEGHLSSVHSQDWPTYQSPANGALLGHNWLLGEYRACNNGWTNAETSGTSADESLFSVLSECKNSPSDLQYEAINSMQFGHAGNFVGGDVPNSYGIIPAYAHHQLNNAPHQNSGLHDSVGRTFLRSWNH